MDSEYTEFFIVEADCMNVENFKHRATVGKVVRGISRDFTFFSDEPEQYGGDDAHPSPLDYFVAGVGL